MITTLQLAQRLARHLKVENAFQLDADVSLDVLAAINAGIAALYRELPSLYKRTTVSHTLRAPRKLTATFISKYGHAVNDATFEPEMIGCTLRFDNGAADTEITGSNSVLDDLLDDSLVQPATVYFDAIPLQDVIERVVGNVRLYEGTRREPTILLLDDRLRGGRARWRNDGWVNWLYGGTDQVGRPQCYYLDPVGASQGGEPEFLLRVAPFPVRDFTVRMEVELSPRPVTFGQLAQPVKINVADALEDVLIALCEEALLTSPFWRDPALARVVEQRAETARERHIRRIAPLIAPPRHRVGTPRGF